MFLQNLIYPTGLFFYFLIKPIIKFVMKNIFSEKNNGINLVVGAGLSGAVIAERLANALDERVIIIDKNSYIGGLAYDYKNRNGNLIAKYGTHIFHTDSRGVWDYISSFSEFYEFYQRTSAYVDGILIPLPFNITTLHALFPESLAKKLEYKLLNLFSYNSDVSLNKLKMLNDSDLNFLADFISNKLVKPYANKLLGELIYNFSVENFPYSFIRISRDSRTYTNKFQGIPKKGYTNLIENMLKNHNIEVCLNTDYNYMVSKNFKRIFFTGSIDDCFNYKFGMLQYKSVKLKFEESDEYLHSQMSVIKYPEDFEFSAVHYFSKDDRTVTAKEYWSDYVYGENERAYPVRDKNNISLYKCYSDYSKDFKNICFSGRLGRFTACNMAQTVACALNLFDELYTNHLSYDVIDRVVYNCG